MPKALLRRSVHFTTKLFRIELNIWSEARQRRTGGDTKNATTGFGSNRWYGSWGTAKGVRWKCGQSRNVSSIDGAGEEASSRIASTTLGRTNSSSKPEPCLMDFSFQMLLENAGGAETAPIHGVGIICVMKRYQCANQHERGANIHQVCICTACKFCE
jgi:hypothetical protein